MRLNRLLISTCAAAALAWPAASLAQPTGGQQGQPGQGDQQHHHAAHGQSGGQGGQGSQGGPTGQSNQGQTGQPGSHGGHHHTYTGGAVVPGGQSGQAGQGSGGQGGPTGTPHGFPQGPFTGGQGVAEGVQTQHHGHHEAQTPPGLPRLGAFDLLLRGADRDRAGQEWRSEHHGWDQRSPWKRDPDWWRHDSGFRLFLGPRLGFFFIPDLGYIAAPPAYQDHYWRIGDDLPQWFWRYQVRDYWRYGLPEPPDGCAWVWVDDDVALIDLDDGYILDIVHNVW